MSARVAVLMGGRSAERDVSLVSGAAIAKALGERGVDALTLDVGPDIALRLAELRPHIDVAFNALHGRWGEDGCMQGLCALLDLPCTHSGVLASALAMDKPVARRLFAAAGVPVAEGKVASREALCAGDPLPRPFVVKPCNEGSSIDVAIVGEDDPPFAGRPWRWGESVLVEAYVPGREITVAVKDGRALGALEIRPRDGFYDYKSKYTAGEARYLSPAPMPEADYAAALEHAERAHDALACAGVTRADFRYDDSPGGAGLRLLEINTQPGMTPGSLVPAVAAQAGIPYPDLVAWMVEDARCRV